MFRSGSHSTQQSFLRRRNSEQVFSKIRYDAASILSLRDKDTCFSRESTISTDRESTIDVQFDFDHELMSSWVYRWAFASLVKQKMETERGRGGDLVECKSVTGLRINDELDVQSTITVRGNVKDTTAESLHAGQTETAAAIAESSKVNADIRSLASLFDATNKSTKVSDFEDYDDEDYPGLAELAGSRSTRPIPHSHLCGCSAAYQKRLQSFASTLEVAPVEEQSMDELPFLPTIPAVRVHELELPHRDSGGSNNPCTATKRSKNVSFADEPSLYYKTWSVAKGNRAEAPMAVNQLTPAIALAIKEELNEFKMKVG